MLVLTVDPARRLANALGLEQFGNVETQVPASAFEASGVEPRGELWAAMLDTKQSWDDLVHRHAPDAKTRDAILANTLYQNISGRFVQSHDYIAMERLYEIHTTGTYDLIVVDTPPTRNAIDFLDAPERMAEFFSSRLLRWLTAPAKSRVVNFASKPFYTVADRILGSQFLEDIAEFFGLFQKMAPGFVERADAVTRTLSDRRTTFVVVSTLEAAPVHEAEYFIEELERRHLHLGALVLNKVLPSYLRRTAATGVARALVQRRRRDRRQAARRRCRPGGRRPGAADGGGGLPQLPGRGQARGRAAGRAGQHPRGGGHRPVLRRRHPRPRRPPPPRREHLALRSSIAEPEAPDRGVRSASPAHAGRARPPTIRVVATLPEIARDTH